MVAVACFGVRVSVMFHLMFVYYTLSSIWVAEWPFLGNSCQVGWPNFIFVFCLFVILCISHFGFKSGIWLLIAPVNVHCLSITFIQYMDATTDLSISAPYNVILNIYIFYTIFTFNIVVFQ